MEVDILLSVKKYQWGVLITSVEGLIILNLLAIMVVSLVNFIPDVKNIINGFLI